MSEIKTDDLSSAIETLAKSLGMAAEEIIPHYVRLEIIRGILWIFGGLLFVVFPFILFWPITPLPGQVHASNGLYCEISAFPYFVYTIKWAICIVFPWAGGYTILDHFENLIAPKALAISKLIGQVR